MTEHVSHPEKTAHTQPVHDTHRLSSVIITEIDGKLTGDNYIAQPTQYHQ